MKKQNWKYEPEEHFAFQRFENLLNKLYDAGLKDVTTDKQERNGTFAFKSSGNRRSMYYTITNPSISRKKSHKSLPKHLQTNEERIVVRRSYPSHASMSGGSIKNPIAVKEFTKYEEALAWILKDFTEKFPKEKPKKVDWKGLEKVQPMYEGKNIKLTKLLKEIDLSKAAPNSFSGWFHNNNEIVNKEFEKPTYSPQNMFNFLNTQFDTAKVNISPEKRNEIKTNLMKYGNNKTSAMKYIYDMYLAGYDLGVNGPNSLGKKGGRINELLNRFKKTLNEQFEYTIDLHEDLEMQAQDLAQHMVNHINKGYITSKYELTENGEQLIDELFNKFSDDEINKYKSDFIRDVMATLQYLYKENK